MAAFLAKSSAINPFDVVCKYQTSEKQTSSLCLLFLASQAKADALNEVYIDLCLVIPRDFHLPFR